MFLGITLSIKSFFPKFHNANPISVPNKLKRNVQKVSARSEKETTAISPLPFLWENTLNVNFFSLN